MPDPLDAGEFSAWLVDVQQAIAGAAVSDVPCGSCTACCASSQFIHIEPDETDALAHIPAELLFPAPRLSRGHQLMGYTSDIDDTAGRPLPTISTQRAALAIALHSMFLAPNPPPTVATVRMEFGRITSRSEW